MSVFQTIWAQQYLGRAPRTFIHAGCFEAIHTIRFKEAFPDCRVIALEACPDNYASLVANKKDEIIEIVHAALCDHGGEVKFVSSYSSGGECGSGSILTPSQKLHEDNNRLRFTEPRIIPAVTLDKFCGLRGIKEIDILHLDVQGAEALALMGFGLMRPKLLFVEISETEHYDGAASLSNLKAALKHMGYRHSNDDGYGALYLHDPEYREMILFSILIPSIPSRFGMAQKLVQKLEAQIGDFPVEVLVFIDNKKRSIGMKRDALVQMTQGSHLAFCDDDDDVNFDYVSEIVSAIRANPDIDVIVFDQRVFLNKEKPFIVHFGLEFENEQSNVNPDGTRADIKRLPFQVCAWKSSIAKASRFPDVNYSEDSAWLNPMWKNAKSQHRINKVLHEYHYSDSVSEAKNA